MKNKCLNATLVAITVLFITLGSLSCTKKKADVVPGICKKIVSVVASDRTLTFTYDSDGRVISTREVVTGTYAPETGTYIYTYTTNGKLAEYIHTADNPVYPDSSSRAKTSKFSYIYDASGHVLTCIKIEEYINSGTISDTTFFTYTGSNTVVSVRKKYLTNTPGHPALLDSTKTFVSLDVDGDPIMATYQPYKDHYYDTVSIPFSRDTLILFSQYEYESNTIDFSPYPPYPETALNHTKTLKQYTQYSVFGVLQSDRVVIFQIANQYGFDATGRVSSIVINDGIILQAPPSYNFNAQALQFNFQQINYDCK